MDNNAAKSSVQNDVLQTAAASPYVSDGGGAGSQLD